MKKFRFILVFAAAVGLAGCAMLVPMGSVYTGVKLPMTATGSGSASARTGEATCTSVLAMVAVGDCSIEAAMKNGGITKVNHVDWQVQNILGIYGTYKVIVWGE